MVDTRSFLPEQVAKAVGGDARWQRDRFGAGHVVAALEEVPLGQCLELGGVCRKDRLNLEDQANVDNGKLHERNATRTGTAYSNLLRPPLQRGRRYRAPHRSHAHSSLESSLKISSLNLVVYFSRPRPMEMLLHIAKEFLRAPLSGIESL